VVLYKRTCGSNPLAFSESQSFPGKDGFSSCFLSSKHFLQQTLLYFFQQAAQVVVPLLLSYRYHLLGTHFPLIYICKFDFLFWMNGHIIIQVVVWQNYIWIDLLHVKLLFSIFPFISCFFLTYIFLIDGCPPCHELKMLRLPQHEAIWDLSYWDLSLRLQMSLLFISCVLENTSMRLGFVWTWMNSFSVGELALSLSFTHEIWWPMKVSGIRMSGGNYSTASVIITVLIAECDLVKNIGFPNPWDFGTPMLVSVVFLVLVRLVGNPLVPSVMKLPTVQTALIF